MMIWFFKPEPALLWQRNGTVIHSKFLSRHLTSANSKRRSFGLIRWFGETLKQKRSHVKVGLNLILPKHQRVMRHSVLFWGIFLLLSFFEATISRRFCCAFVCSETKREGMGNQPPLHSVLFFFVICVNRFYCVCDTCLWVLWVKN